MENLRSKQRESTGGSGPGVPRVRLSPGVAGRVGKRYASRQSYVAGDTSVDLEAYVTTDARPRALGRRFRTAGCRAIASRQSPPSDRKSTRLNSSHGYN